MVEDADVRGGRSPHGWIGGAEEEEAREAASGSEVTNAAVVAEEKPGV